MHVFAETGPATFRATHPHVLPGGATSDAAAAALDRVLGSQTFSKTGRLSSFLRHVCRAHAENRFADLTEQHIGQQVFNRAGGFNPAEDTIVRTTARLLRQRLAAYYDTEGAGDELRIVIPRGGYAPVYVEAPDTPLPNRSSAGADAPATGRSVADRPTVEAAADAVAIETGALQRWRQQTAATWRRLQSRTRRIALLFAAVFALAAATSLCAFAISGSPPSRSSAMWASMFVADRDTLLVPADSGLVLYQLDARRQLSLEDYIAKRFGSEAGHPEEKFLRNRHTQVSSVALGMELGKLASASPERFHMRYARDLRLGELKQSNAILVGVRQSNPWMQLFSDRLNFHIDWDIATEKFLIRNDQPLPGERAVYEFSRDDPDKRGFAYIAYTRSLAGDGHALLIGGTTAAGTEAAEEFLLDRHRLDTVLQHAAAADGSVAEFEVLLQCVLLAGGSTDVRVVGVRTGRS